jgi:hypothetical protein
VSLVSRRRVTLSLENVSQMSSAIAAHDLCPLHAKCAVGVSSYSTRNSVEEGGPTAARFELVLSGVDGRIAAGTSVGAGSWRVLVVFA